MKSTHFPEMVKELKDLAHMLEHSARPDLGTFSDRLRELQHTTRGLLEDEHFLREAVPQAHPEAVTNEQLVAAAQRQFMQNPQPMSLGGGPAGMSGNTSGDVGSCPVRGTVAFGG